MSVEKQEDRFGLNREVYKEDADVFKCVYKCPHTPVLSGRGT